MSRTLAVIQQAVFGAALFAGLIVTPACAKGTLNFVGKFVNADTEVDLATYAELNDKGVEERIGLVGLRNGERRNSFAFDATEYAAIQMVWDAAIKGTGSDWHAIGACHENGTSDVSQMRVSAGPAIRFVIESPQKGAFTTDLETSQIQAFSSGLIAIRDYIGAQGQDIRDNCALAK